MTKYEYIAKLEKLLADMPSQERRDALEYYAEYFDAAGPDHEAETAEKLGDPETVARQILEGAGLAGEDAGKAGPDLSQPVSGATDSETPADGSVTRTGLHGPGLLVLFVVILLLVALALGLSAAATGFRGFGRDREMAVTANEPTVSEEPAALPAQTPVPETQNTATPAPAADASTPAAVSANAPADTQAPADWETAYSMTITEVDLELSQVNLTVTVDDTVSAVTLRGTGVADSALQVDQKELEQESKLDAKLSGKAGEKVNLTLALPAQAMPRRLELKLYGGSAVLPEDMTLEELEVDSVGAAVTAGTVTARQVDLQEESNGTTTIGLINAVRQLEVDAKGGSVTATIQGQAADFRLETENRSGTLVVDGEEKPVGKSSRPGSTNSSVEVECEGGTVTLSFTG